MKNVVQRQHQQYNLETLININIPDRLDAIAMFILQDKNLRIIPKYERNKSLTFSMRKCIKMQRYRYGIHRKLRNPGTDNVMINNSVACNVALMVEKGAQLRKVFS